VLEIKSLDRPEEVSWRLPPSKSHMIRWMVLASQCSSPTELLFNGEPGRDIEDMAKCLEKFGARVFKESGKWVIEGNSDGLGEPPTKLWCGNSGTTARIVTAILAGMEVSGTIDGDDSLRARDGSSLANALRGLGCNISSDRLPCTVEGPIAAGYIEIDLSESSQALSALLLASPSFPSGIEARVLGRPVSRGYSELTIQICEMCGWSQENTDRIMLEPWEVRTPERAFIPGELSLLPLSILFDTLHGTKTQASITRAGFPRVVEAIDAVRKSRGGPVSLRDASDIITPAAFLMALGSGGEISDVAHSRGKESDRISNTVRLMEAFGIESTEFGDGIAISGGQKIIKPKQPVITGRDHRTTMTAIVLASMVGGTISGPEWCEVTHPGFVEMVLGEHN
jgi:3-phosphoshikimate 1-carboxyvinyltransferase|tara:strand:+ start:54917 stop:56107 length:1191 start_codon:yes stop_codon:yes gene_type:complete